MRKIILFLILLLTANLAYGDEPPEDTVRVYGHIFENTKNNPLKHFFVTIEKDWETIADWKTNKEGAFDLVIKNRDDYLNLCIESTSLSEIQWVRICETISVFQNIWREVWWVKIREVEHDFYTNSKWENLQEKLLDDITHQSKEEAYNEYIELIEEEKRKEQAEIESKRKEDELAALKEDYKMPVNTEMLWPLESINIIWSVEVIWTEHRKELLRVAAVSHSGKVLYSEPLDKYSSFDINLIPDNNGFFLHPVNLKIYSIEKKIVGWKEVDLLKPKYKLITRQNNIINFKLEETTKEDLVKVVAQKEKFPFWLILIILWISIAFSVVKSNNKLALKERDYD